MLKDLGIRKSSLILAVIAILGLGFVCIANPMPAGAHPSAAPPHSSPIVIPKNVGREAETLNAGFPRVAPPQPHITQSPWNQELIYLQACGLAFSSPFDDSYSSSSLFTQPSLYPWLSVGTGNGPSPYLSSWWGQNMQAGWWPNPYFNPAFAPCANFEGWSP